MSAPKDKVMRAAVIERIEMDAPLRIRDDVDVPELTDQQVLVQIMASGVCHTDLHVAHGDIHTLKAKPPLIPGHEGAGIVAKLGDKARLFRVGDRVGISWLNSACLNCDMCLSANEPYCPHMTPTGFRFSGTHSEYIAINENWLVRLPSSLSFSQCAPLMCAGLTSYKAIKEANVRAGQWLVIIGAAGGLGHLACQYAHAMALKTIAIDAGRERLDQIDDAIVNAKLDSSDPNLIATIKRNCDGGLGPNAVVVLAPSIDCYKMALSVVRAHGTVVGVAFTTESLPIDVSDLIIRGVTLRGSNIGSRLDLVETLRLAEDANIKPDIHERSLRDLPDVIDQISKKAITGRVVLKIGDRDF